MRLEEKRETSEGNLRRARWPKAKDGDVRQFHRTRLGMRLCTHEEIGTVLGNSPGGETTMKRAESDGN